MAPINCNFSACMCIFMHYTLFALFCPLIIQAAQYGPGYKQAIENANSKVKND